MRTRYRIRYVDPAALLERRQRRMKRWRIAAGILVLAGVTVTGVLLFAA